MTGSLRESHYEAVRDDFQSSQLQLSDFDDSDGSTTIAVTTQPKDLGTFCDEVRKELGMPERHLKRYWQYRSGFQSNSAVDNPAERAFEEARLDHYYRRHIQCSDEAQAALSELVSRLSDGEDITLVCFEKPAEPCHRHILMELIEARLSSNYDFSSEEKRDKQLAAGASSD
jgi:hypothetical protein